MNRIWRVRAALVLLVAVFGIILIMNFQAPSVPEGEQNAGLSGRDVVSSPVPTQETGLQAGEGTRIMQGTHQILDKKGKPLGKLYFKEAVQAGGATRMHGIRAVLHDGSELRTDRAAVEDDLIRFPDKLTISQKDGFRLMVPPGAVMRGEEVTGTGGITIETPTIQLKGRQYRLNVTGNFVILESEAHLSVTKSGVTGRAMRGWVDLTDGRLILMQEVHLKLPFSESTARFQCDAALIRPSENTCRLVGAVRTQMGNRRILTTDLQWRSESTSTGNPSIEIRALAYVSIGQTWFAIPSGSITPDGDMRAPWLVGEMNHAWFTTGRATLSKNGQFHALSPRIRAADGLTMRGRVIDRPPGQVAHITDVIGWDQALRFQADHGFFDAETARIDGAVRILSREWAAVADRADRKGRGWAMTRAIAYRESDGSWFAADRSLLRSPQSISGRGHAMLITELLGEGRVTLTADGIEWRNQRLYGEGHVQIVRQGERILGDRCWLAPRFGVITQAKVKGDSPRIQARAGVLVVEPRNRLSLLLHRAWATDETGNVLQADQLTWQRSTGRISAYGKSTNVRFKLEL